MVLLVLSGKVYLRYNVKYEYFYKQNPRKCSETCKVNMYI